MKDLQNGKPSQYLLLQKKTTIIKHYFQTNVGKAFF